MVALTSSSSAARARTSVAAWLSTAFGVLAVAAIPAGVAAARYVPSVSLLQAVTASVPAAFVLALVAVLTARRARRVLALTLGRRRTDGAARTGRALGLLGLYVACSGGISLGFFELLVAYS